ncbi:MAG: hypothetical protein IPI79_05415 [Moraxellaceae bacterium]|nr:hypothetical protein [Moraxellaceae bacterium]
MMSSCLVACQSATTIETNSVSKKITPSGYMSTIGADGASVVVRFPNGQERELSSAAPSYSATIGAISVQGKNNH